MDLPLVVLLAATTISAEIHKHGLQHRPRDHPHTHPILQRSSSSSSEEFTLESPFPVRFSPNPNGLDLTGDLRKRFAYIVANDAQDSNVVCSPVSALLPLGTLAFGASRTTFNELARAVGAKNEDQISVGFVSLLTSLEELKGITLKIASRIYINLNQNLKRGFLSKTKRVFESAVEKVDLDNGREAAHTINLWVEERTNGKISDLVDPSDVRGSELVLVNAIYFSGNWQKKFNKARQEEFIGPNGIKAVNMMHTRGHFDYYECPILRAQIVAIPYVNSKLRMVLVVPKKVKGLDSLLVQLTRAPEKLSKAIDMMNTKYVKVKLPRFRVESELALGDIYRKIDLKRLMSSRPELNEIVQSSRDLRIGTAKQKAFIEIDENGTTAAAATEVPMKMMASRPSPIEATVVANRPFMFYILAGNQQLFFGTVTDPKDF